MGVEDNQYQISNLNANTSFFDWYTKENDDVIAKLNKLKIYEIDVAGSLLEGISAELGTSGGHTSGYLNLGVADKIPHGITIEGCVVVTDCISFTHTASAATAGITPGYFVCVDQAGGITLSAASYPGASAGGIPFKKHETIGVVESVKGNSVSIVGSGKFGGFSGLTAGQVYYLDAAVTGGYTTNAPSASATTKLKVFISTSITEGIVQIGDSTTN